MPVAVVPWDDMTPEQREFTIYLYASMYMQDVLKWETIPEDVLQKRRLLDNAWDGYFSEENTGAPPAR